MESNAKVKFSIVNRGVGYEQIAKPDVDYHIRDNSEQVQPQQEAVEAVEEEKKEDEEPVYDIRLSYQSVVSQDLLTDQLAFKLITNGIEQDIQVEFETVQDPQPEMLLQAKLEFN